MPRKIGVKDAYDAFDGKPVTCVDIKGWLIFYNIVLDNILADVNARCWSASIAWNSNLHEFERHVLILEDRRFFGHRGFDIYRSLRVLRQLISFRRVGGVSTIEQQYIRTYLNRRERTLGRKFHEIILAWLLSHRAEKKQILRAYLHTAYFGYRLNGCDAASKLVFEKFSSDLAAQEAAFVASLLVYPLPKSVISLAGLQALFPVHDLNGFLNAASAVAPWWASRIAARLNYSMHLIAQSEKSKEQVID